MKPAHAILAPRRGLTLLELLLVMVILGVVVGIGMGAFADFAPSRSTATDSVRGALRSAVNSARASRAPAAVHIDTGARSIQPRGLVVIGTWHFESEALEGAFGLNGTARGTRLVDGWLGRGVEFPAGADARVEVPIEGDPAFEFSEGFALECALAPDGTRSAHVVAVGNVFGLYLAGNGSVRVWFAAASEEEDEESAGGLFYVDSPEAAVLPGRWTRVRGEYDRRRLVVLVDGVRVAEVEATDRVAPVAGPLVLGGEDPAWVGALDALVVSAWEARPARVLPEGVTFASGTPDEVRFDGAGHVAQAYTELPLELALEFENGTRESVRVMKWGTVE